MSDEKITTCVHCDLPATHFPKGYDEYCDAHFAELNFRECDTCGAVHPDKEITSIMTAHGTYLDPPEYADACPNCERGEAEPDYDDIGD